MPDEAILSSKNEYTIFMYDRYIIRFRAPYSLERYTQVKEWDNGYLVVMAKYSHNQDEIEFFYYKNKLEEIRCRFDLRTLTKEKLIKIIKYVQDIGAYFLVDNKIYQPQLEVMIDVMKQSAANQYCKNPLEYFKSLN